MMTNYLGCFGGSGWTGETAQAENPPRNELPRTLGFYGPILRRVYMDPDVLASLSERLPFTQIYSFSPEHNLDQVEVAIPPTNWDDTRTSIAFRNVYCLKTPVGQTQWDANMLKEFIHDCEIKVVVDTTTEPFYHKLDLLGCGLKRVYSLPLLETARGPKIREQADMVLQVADSLGNEKGPIVVIGRTHEEWALFTAARIARINYEEFEELRELQADQITPQLTNPHLRGLLNRARI